MKKGAQKILLGLIIIVMVVLLVWILKTVFNKTQSSPTSTTTIINSDIASSTPTTTSKTVYPKKTTKIPVLSYTDLVKKFGGYRFQFSNNCSQITPGSMVVKSGYQFMIDNRENTGHTFTFSKQKYFVKPYGYAILTAQTIGNQTIYCDGIQRATVNVAK